MLKIIVWDCICTGNLWIIFSIMTDSFTPIEVNDVNMLHKYYKILLPDSESVCQFVLHVLTASGDLLLCYV